jgi:Ca2+-binding RTX toxin-like protein
MARRRRRAHDLRIVRVPLLILLVAILGVAFFAFANAILGVNSPRLGQNTSGINPTALEPAQCLAAGLAPTNIVAGNTGTAGNDLILGTNAGETINGNGGNDCIVGGAGNDNLRGGAGTDVCIGGPGNDTFNSCAYQYQ